MLHPKFFQPKTYPVVRFLLVPTSYLKCPPSDEDDYDLHLEMLLEQDRINFNHNYDEETQGLHNLLLNHKHLLLPIPTVTPPQTPTITPIPTPLSQYLRYQYCILNIPLLTSSDFSVGQVVAWRSGSG